MIEIQMADGSAIKANNIAEAKECITLYAQMLELMPIKQNRKPANKPKHVFEQYKQYAIAYAEAKGIPKRQFADACVAGQIMMFNELWETIESNAELQNELILFKGRDKQSIKQAITWLNDIYSLELCEGFKAYLYSSIGYIQQTILPKAEVLDCANWPAWQYVSKAFDEAGARAYCDKDSAIGRDTIANFIKRGLQWPAIRNNFAFCLARCKEPDIEPISEAFNALHKECEVELAQFDAIMTQYIQSVYKYI